MTDWDAIFTAISTSMEPRPAGLNERLGDYDSPLKAWHRQAAALRYEPRDWRKPEAAMELLKRFKFHTVLLWYPEDMGTDGVKGWKCFVYDGGTTQPEYSPTPEEAIVLAYYASLPK